MKPKEDPPQASPPLVPEEPQVEVEGNFQIYTFSELCGMVHILNSS